MSHGVWVILLASRSWGPGMLLSTRQGPGTGPPQNGPAWERAHFLAGRGSDRFECCPFCWLVYSTQDSE